MRLINKNRCFLFLITIHVLVLFLHCKKNEELPLLESNNHEYIINTKYPSSVSADSAVLQAEILRIGKSGIVEAGFIISTFEQPDKENGKILSCMKNKIGTCSVVAKNLEPDEKYYFRYYVKTQAEELVLGNIKTLTTKGIHIKDVITSMSDGSSASRGEVIYINGEGFGKTPEENAVLISGIPAEVDYVHYDHTENMTIQAYIPFSVPTGKATISIKRGTKEAFLDKILNILPGTWKIENYLPTGYQFTDKSFSKNDKIYYEYIKNEKINLLEYSPLTETFKDVGITDINALVIRYFNVNDKIFYFSLKDSYTRSYEFFEFDVQINKSIKKQDFPGEDIRDFTSFSVDNKLYIGGGYKNYNNSYHFWSYDPLLDQWVTIEDFPGGYQISGAASFEIEKSAYFTLAHEYPHHVWEYNSIQDEWKRKNDFNEGPSASGVGFSINKTGYVISAYDFFSTDKRHGFWKYDLNNDSWSLYAAFVTFVNMNYKKYVTNGHCYVTYGREGVQSYPVYKFTPEE